MEASLEPIGPDGAEELSRFAYPVWVETYAPLVEGGKKRVDEFYPDWMGPDAVRDLISRGYRFFYIVYGGERAGYLSYKVGDEVLTISKLYLFQDFRGLGLGSWAMDRILESGMNEGCSKAELVVNHYNGRAIAFYKKYGFSEIRRIPEKGTHRPDYLSVMGKDLRYRPGSAESLSGTGKKGQFTPSLSSPTAFRA
jgi:GNAT superfamily N-acetyltransferase